VIIMINQARVSGCRGSLAIASIVFVLASTVSGATAGLALGAVADLLEEPTRLAISLAITVGLLAGSLTADRPWQLDRETDRNWLRHRNWRTAALNGAALGLGLTTRIGYWLWYLLPVGILVLGDWRAGVVLYGTYGAVRGALGVVRAASTATPNLRLAPTAFDATAPIANRAWFAAAGLVSASAATAL
jgi:hypothetical protein